MITISREVALRTRVGDERRYGLYDVSRATSGEKYKSCEIQMVSHFPTQSDQHHFPLYFWIFLKFLPSLPYSDGQNLS